MGLEDLSSRRAFLALLERNISTKIVLSAWCPTMDIVALVTADQQLQSFRLNWERLWSKQPASNITSLQWRPDGKQIAYGDDDGYVVILTAEDGSEAERRRVFPAARKEAHASGVGSGPDCVVGHDSTSSAVGRVVVGLSWTVCGFEAGPEQLPPRSRRLLGHHSHELGFVACSGTDGSSHTYCTPASHNAHEVRSAWEARWARQARDEDPALRMLCAVSAHGDGVVCGEGLLPILAFRMFESGDMPDVEGRNRAGLEEGTLLGSQPGGCVHTNGTIAVRMSSTAEQMWIGWQDGNGLYVSRMDTSILQRHAAMIWSVGRLLSDTLKDLGMLYSMMRNIAAHVAEVEKAREEHLEEMRDILRGMRDPETDIYDFLVRGAYSLELKAFVAKEGALKSAARKIDSAMSCMYHDIVYHLQPSLERIAFRLGDLRGYSMTLDCTRVLGLRPDDAGMVERYALDFVALAEHGRELVLKAASGYRNFYALLAMLQHREMGEKYPSLPKSAIEEVEELVTSRYYSAELKAMLESMADGIPDGGGDPVGNRPGLDGGGHAGAEQGNTKDDEWLAESVFLASTRVHNPNMGVDTTNSGDEHTTNVYQGEREEGAALEHLMSGLDLWLDGGTSVDHFSALVEKKRVELAQRSCEAGTTPAGATPASPLDIFKSSLLDIVACPARALSTHVFMSHHWKLLSKGRTPPTDPLADANTTTRQGARDLGAGVPQRDLLYPFSMELDEYNSLHVLAALKSSFVRVRMSPAQDGHVDVDAGRLPGGRHITSCSMYEKSDAVILTAVPPEEPDATTPIGSGNGIDGSLIAMVPLGDDTCPLHLQDMSLHAPMDDLIGEVDTVDITRCRIRHIAGLQIVAPFAASASRGVALALFAPVNAITIYDLEDDEEEDEEDEEQDEESASDERRSDDENVEM